MKFVFERKFFVERSKNLEQSEKFSHKREQQNLFQLPSEAKNFNFYISTLNSQLLTFNYGYKKLR